MPQVFCFSWHYTCCSPLLPADSRDLDNGRLICLVGKRKAPVSWVLMSLTELHI